jgi:hypothetical protein
MSSKHERLGMTSVLPAAAAAAAAAAATRAAAAAATRAGATPALPVY